MPVQIKASEVKKKMPKFSNVNGSIRPSCANLYNVYYDEDGKEILSPVVINKAAFLATSSEYNDKYYEKQNENLDTPNPKEGNDVAFLDCGVNKFCVKGSLRVVSECLDFSSCQMKDENVDLPTKITNFMNLFKEKGGFHELADRYTRQLVNGDILFRNKYAQNLKVIVHINDNENYIFDDHENDQKFFGNEDGFKRISACFEKALTEPSGFFTPRYEIYGTTNEGGEVYPSQELNMGGKKKELFRHKTMGEPNAAGIHSQKVGNALRTIDDWYTDEGNARKIPVDPYGPDKRTLKAKRRPGSGYTFYEILTGLEQLIARLEKLETPDGDCLFFGAMMVRGGVFNGNKDSKDSKNTE